MCFTNEEKIAKIVYHNVVNLWDFKGDLWQFSYDINFRVLLHYYFEVFYLIHLDINSID